VSPAQVAEEGLSRLGSGGEGDRLGFRLIVATLWRCVALLRPVRWHVAALALVYAAIALILLPLVLVLFDLFWTRALEGRPLTQEAAASFELDPAIAVHVPVLPPEVRRVVARGAMFLTIVGFGGLIPVMLGAYYYKVWILQRVNQGLRLELQQRLQTLSLRFHADSQVGDAIYRIYQDSAMVTQLIDVLFLTPLFASIRFAFLLAIVALFDPRLAWVLVLVPLPMLGVGAAYSRRLRVGFRAAREANSRLTSNIQETLAGIKVIKAYAAEGAEQERFEQNSRAAFGTALAARSRLARFGVAIFWLVGFALLATTAAATFATRDGETLYAGAALASAGLATWNLGAYNAFKWLAGNSTDQVRLLFRTWGRTQDVAIGLDRVFELLDLEPEVQDAPDALELPPVKEGVVFRSVRFRYQPDRPALEEASFEARPGTITAIVGPTGSGKSTLMALLLRLFDPDRGAIEIDGVDLRRLQVASLRRRVAIALQENVLFGATIRENIRYALPDASDEQVRSAARVACADEFVSALPEGYDALLGERGAKLSSGQRQRLGIARAVLKAPDILVLDEPTASLDAATEQQVMRALSEWGAARTIFLITHRLSTVRRADQIVYLSEGRVIEQGTHEALMQRSGGAYRRLVEAESGAPQPDERVTA
jgi:ABC-type multidrug transport system fused ATPase/permease subunit